MSIDLWLAAVGVAGQLDLLNAGPEASLKARNRIIETDAAIVVRPLAIRIWVYVDFLGDHYEKTLVQESMAPIRIPLLDRNF